MSVCGHIRPHCDPRDQKQDLYGDQPVVLQEGGSSGDPGPDAHGPAEAEEDEWLRWNGTRFAGVRQLFFCTLTKLLSFSPELQNHSSHPYFLSVMILYRFTKHHLQSK